MALTADGKGHRIAGAVTDSVGHVTSKRPLVIAGHGGDGERVAFVAELNSVAGRDIGAAVHPTEGDGRSERRAGQTDGAVELHQVCAVGR